MRWRTYIYTLDGVKENQRKKKKRKKEKDECTKTGETKERRRRPEVCANCPPERMKAHEAPRGQNSGDLFSRLPNLTAVKRRKKALLILTIENHTNFWFLSSWAQDVNSKEMEGPLKRPGQMMVGTHATPPTPGSTRTSIGALKGPNYLIAGGNWASRSHRLLRGHRCGDLLTDKCFFISPFWIFMASVRHDRWLLFFDTSPGLMRYS